MATVVTVGAEKAQRFYKNAPARQPQFSPVMNMPGDPIVPRKVPSSGLRALKGM
jgi:hypothetical protein